MLTSILDVWDKFGFRCTCWPQIIITPFKTLQSSATQQIIHFPPTSIDDTLARSSSLPDNRLPLPIPRLPDPTPVVALSIRQNLIGGQLVGL